MREDKPARRREPLEPRYTIRHTLGRPGGEQRVVRLPVICYDCEAAFLGRWERDGSPAYKGGWRLAQQRDRDTGRTAWVYAPCRCAVGQIVAKGSPRVPPVPHHYPPTLAVAYAKEGEPYNDELDAQPITDQELAAWRERHHADPPEAEVKAEADWMLEDAF